MADYIDRKELLKEIKAYRRNGYSSYSNDLILDIINSQPVIEQKHAHWELGYVMSDNDRREFCSNCNYPRFRNNSAYWRYCPYCGAKMDEEAK